MASTPDHFVVQLFDTKADQHGTNPPHAVAAPLAVAAMWRWMIARRSLARTAAASSSSGTTPDFLFALPGTSAIALPQVVTYLQDLLESRGHGRPHITGKSFRRGGASDLVAANVPADAAAAAGRWKSAAMPLVYANRVAKQSQSLEISRRAMGRR